MKKERKSSKIITKENLVRISANVDMPVAEWIASEAQRLGDIPESLIIRHLLRKAKDSGEPVIIGG